MDENAVLRRALRISAIVVLVAIVTVATVVFISTRDSNQRVVNEETVMTPVVSKSEIETPNFHFTDITQSSGIDFEHENGARGDRYLPETMGGGVAVFDFDLDGDLDILFVNSKEWPSESASSVEAKSALYQNDGTGHFKNISDTHLNLSVYGMGPAIGDVNGDRYPDLFVAALGENKLFINDAGNGFVDVTEQYGVAGDSNAFSSCATFFDYDQDGDLDLFVCNYVGWSQAIDQQVDFRLTGVGRAYGPPTDFPGSNSWLYRNDGESFTDVTEEAGLQILHAQTGAPTGKALAVAAVDLNDDRAPDVLIANDTVRNFLFLNQGDGTFKEQGIEFGIAFDPSGSATGAMGLDVARYNNDERIGIAIGNFANEMTSFYVSDPAIGVYSDDAIPVGIGAATRKVLTFGLFFFDADLDGRQDLLTVNGHIEPEISTVQASQDYQQAPQFFWNCGRRCSRDFVLVESVAGDFDQSLVGRGAAYGDFDGDGRLDVLLTHVGGKPRLLRNETNTEANWLNVSLQYESANPYGIGSTIAVSTDAGTQTRNVTRTKSYLAQVDASAHFGLGEYSDPLEVNVTWPDGSTQKFDEIKPNQTIVLVR